MAVIIPEHPNSKPFNNFNSEPGKIEKFSNFKFSNKLYELSFNPTIWLGNFFTSSLTQSILNLYPHNFSKL